MEQPRTTSITLPILIAALLVPLAATFASAETESDRERRRFNEKLDKTIKPKHMFRWQPEPGRVRVAAMKPTWCDLTTAWKGKLTGGYLRRALGQVKRFGLGERLLVKVAEMLCARPNQPTWRQQTGYVVQKYVNETGLGKKDAVAGIRARLDKRNWKRNRKSFCKTLPPGGEASAETKRLYRARRVIYGCQRYKLLWRGRSGSESRDQMAWYVDKRPQMASEVIKAFWVLDCLKDSQNISANRHHKLAKYAVCGMDARSLSRARLETELRRAPHNSYSRVIARETFGAATAAAARYKAVIDAIAKRDPAYKKIFFDAPRAGWNKWVANYSKHKAMYEGALAFERALHGPSRRAINGCRGRLRGLLGRYLKSKKIRNKKQAYKAISDDVGGPLLAALVSCSGHEGNRWEGKTYASLVRKVRNSRGPRYAAFYAVIDAVEDIRKDRSRFPLTARHFGYLPEPDRGNTQRTLWSARRLSATYVIEKAKGTVRRLTKTKHGVRLSFKRTRVKEDVMECTPTNRVWKIDSNGRVLYHDKCKFVGTKWVDTTPKPVTVPADAAAGIRRGSYVKLIADMAYGNAKVLRRGHPIVVFKTKRKQRIVAAFGFKL